MFLAFLLRGFSHECDFTLDWNFYWIPSKSVRFYQSRYIFSNCVYCTIFHDRHLLNSGSSSERSAFSISLFAVSHDHHVVHMVVCSSVALLASVHHSYYLKFLNRRETTFSKDAFKNGAPFLFVKIIRSKSN